MNKFEEFNLQMEELMKEKEILNKEQNKAVKENIELTEKCIQSYEDLDFTVIEKRHCTLCNTEFEVDENSAQWYCNECKEKIKIKRRNI